MPLDAIEKEVTATLQRIKRKNRDFKKALEKAYGYAVFPSVGRAGLILGGAFGRGQVFEHGKAVGFASMGQVTVGVQVGGDTFSELVLFNSRDAFERFKRGRYAFTANASAVLVKAAAAGTVDFDKDVVAQAFGRGGMLLELSLGAQKFNFYQHEEARTGSEPGEAEPTQEAGAHPPSSTNKEAESHGIGQRTRALIAAATSKLGSVPSRIAHRYRHPHA